MPFTLAHPAAGLPLLRPLGRYGVWPALAAGTMAPDLPYFAALPIPRDATHTVTSLIWFSLPAGAFMYWLFVVLLRRPAVFLLPGPLRARLSRPPPRAALLPVACSVLAGAATHIAWDSFTHDTGVLVQKLPALRRLLIDLWGYPVWSYKVLQHGSTLLGAALLAYSARRWFLRSPAERLAPEPGWAGALRTVARLVLCAVPPLVGIALGLRRAPPAGDLDSIAWFLAWASVGSVSTLVAGVALLGLALARCYPARELGGEGA